MKTQGRYAVVIAKDWPERRFAAALGFEDTLPDACAAAHEFGCRHSPVAVIDTGVFPIACVHVTHGSVFDIPGLFPVGEEPDMAVRQTSCRYCGGDIENFSPYRAGQWMDRGGNLRCPTPAGDAGLEHAPIRAGSAFRVGQPVHWCDPDDGLCSGNGVIVSLHRHDSIAWLRMESGSETEALTTELIPR